MRTKRKTIRNFIIEENLFSRFFERQLFKWQSNIVSNFNPTNINDNKLVCIRAFSCSIPAGLEIVLNQTINGVLSWLTLGISLNKTEKRI